MSNKKSEKKYLQNLGGWLIFFQIFFFWLLFESIYRVIFNTKGSLFQIILIFLIGYSLILFYQKKKNFLKWGDYTLRFIVVIPLLSILFLGGTLIGVVIVAIIAIIFIIYLKKSKKVKNTFTN